MKLLKGTKKTQALRMYLILAALFICCLVTGNLIFQKFISWNPLGLFNFELSVGVLPYPITFLVTDLVSEVYGRKKADDVVKVGIVALFFMLAIV